MFKFNKFSILIIEDQPPKESPYFEYVTKLEEKLKEKLKKLDYEDVSINIVSKKEDFKNLKNFLDKSYDIAILDYDLRYFDTFKNGWMYMDDILKRNSHCEIVLVTTDERIDRDIENLDPHQRDLISEKNTVVYISKSFPSSEFNDRIYDHVANKLRHLLARHELQKILLDTAIASYKTFMSAKVRDLIGTPAIEERLTDIREKEISVKGDTLQLDLITEEIIKSNFKPRIHSDDVVICTEELGIANKLIYRVHRPRFYIFSDPLDGSSALKEWLREKSPDKVLRDLINDPEEIEKWQMRWGPIMLNAPMISIVLAERHQVAVAVIVNIFTGDVYLSDNSGNYKSRIDPEKYTINGQDELKFRTFYNGVDKIFICTLQAGKYEKYMKEKKGKPQDFQFLMHFRECIQSIIPSDYNLTKSFEKRKQRHDFTPGPGRILFLTEVAEECSRGVEDNEKELYSCILSSGEPLTEWVGWFAFLRHAPHISAYCLRTGSGKVCQHQIQRADIKGTMIPPEVASLFKSGMLDFEVLHTGYRGAMPNYTDSIVVFFNNDDSWTNMAKRKLDERMLDGFVRIET